MLPHQCEKRCPAERDIFKKHRLLPVFPGGQVLAHHQRYPEDDSVVELPQVQACQLADLLQPVDQGVPVDEQLPGGLGYVQAVLKELVDGKEGLLIQRIQGVLLENLPQEDLAQGGRQLIDQTAMPRFS